MAVALATAALGARPAAVAQTRAADLRQMLRLARRAAGGRRVVNRVELWVVSEDNDK
jgi:hypothetical protein